MIEMPKKHNDRHPRLPIRIEWAINDESRFEIVKASSATEALSHFSGFIERHNDLAKRWATSICLNISWTHHRLS